MRDYRVSAPSILILLQVHDSIAIDLSRSSLPKNMGIILSLCADDDQQNNQGGPIPLHKRP